MSGPTVSVIVPAYQAATALPATLAALAGQTRPAEEVVVVDDGSTDGTADVARTWADHLPVQVVRLPRNLGAGRGAGGARHAGILRSRGELVALVDADDLALPDHLESMVATWQANGGLVTADHLLWVPGRRLGTRPASELLPLPPPDRQLVELVAENFVFVGSVFSRRLYEQAGGMRNIRCEDWDLWVRMALVGARISRPDHVTMLYRQAPSSVSGTDKLLQGDLDLLGELAGSLPPRLAGRARRARERRVAKRRFLDGVAAHQAGRRADARRAWWGAIVAERSLRGGRSRLNGNVSVRALACLVAPERAVGHRDHRQRSAARVVGGGRGRP